MATTTIPPLSLEAAEPRVSARLIGPPPPISPRQLFRGGKIRGGTSAEAPRSSVAWVPRGCRFPYRGDPWRGISAAPGASGRDVPTAVNTVGSSLCPSPELSSLCPHGPRS